MTEQSLYVSRNGQVLFQTNLDDNMEVFTQLGVCTLHDEPCLDVTVNIGAALTQAEAEAIEEQAEEAPPLTLTYDDMTVEELKGLLRDNDLPVSGNKAELVDRLTGDGL